MSRFSLYLVPENSSVSGKDNHKTSSKRSSVAQTNTQNMLASLVELKAIDANPNAKVKKLKSGAVCLGEFFAGPNIERFLPGFTYANRKQQISFRIWEYLTNTKSNKAEIVNDIEPEAYNSVLEVVNADQSIDDLELLLQVLEGITQNDYMVVSCPNGQEPKQV